MGNAGSAIIPAEESKELVASLLVDYASFFERTTTAPSKWIAFICRYCQTARLVSSLEESHISWLTFRKLRKEDEEFRRMWLSIDDYITEKVLDIAQAAATNTNNPDLNFIKWFLSKRIPDRYGDRVKIEAEIQSNLSTLSNEELEELIHRGQNPTTSS